MLDPISVTGDQCAALPQGDQHDCDRSDNELKSLSLSDSSTHTSVWLQCEEQ